MLWCMIMVITIECIFFQTFFLGLLQEDQKLEHDGGGSSSSSDSAAAAAREELLL